MSSSPGLKDWPSYGYFPYNGKYFRMHRGQSNKQLADIPSLSIFNLVQELSRIEDISSDINDFSNKAKETIDKFNTELPVEIEAPEGMIRASIDNFYWGNKDPKLGLKIIVDSRKFRDFLLKRSKSTGRVWKTFEYIYASKNIFLQKTIQLKNFDNNIIKYAEEVKKFAFEELRSVKLSSKTLDNGIKNSIYSIVSNLEKERKRTNRSLAYFLYALIYFNELKVKNRSLEVLASIGDFPACLSEMRRMIEGLAFHMFLDLLQIRALRFNKAAIDMDLFRLFSQGVIKEAEDLHVRPSRIFVGSDGKINNRMLEGLIERINLEKDRKVQLVQNIYDEMSISSYVLLLGQPRKKHSKMKSWSEVEVKNSNLMFIGNLNGENKEFFNLGVREITRALSGVGIDKNEEEITEHLLREIEEGEMVVSAPTSKYPFDFLRHALKTSKTWEDLESLYNELSPFVHTCWESSIVWPFTSVLEIMTYNNILRHFAELVLEALKGYLNFIDSEWEHLVVS